MNTLHATLTHTHRGEPLATVDGLPGGGADLTPDQLRALAATLLRIADDCESRPAPGKHAFRTVSRDYILT
jgi:hypothetical protein